MTRGEFVNGKALLAGLAIVLMASLSACGAAAEPSAGETSDASVSVDPSPEADDAQATPTFERTTPLPDSLKSALDISLQGFLELDVETQLAFTSWATQNLPEYAERYEYAAAFDSADDESLPVASPENTAEEILRLANYNYRIAASFGLEEGAIDQNLVEKTQYALTSYSAYLIAERAVNVILSLPTPYNVDLAATTHMNLYPSEVVSESQTGIENGLPSKTIVIEGEDQDKKTVWAYRTFTDFRGDARGAWVLQYFTNAD